MRKLAWFAVGFALATLSILGDAPIQLTWWQYGLFALLALAPTFLRPKTWKRMGFALLGLCLGLIWLQHLEVVQQSWNQRNEGNYQFVTMVATDFSQESTYGYMVMVDLDGCDGWLYYSEPVDIAVGDTITATCRVKANPTYGDWDNLWKKAVGYDFTANYNGDDFTCISPESADFIYYPAYFAEKIRETLPVIANENTSAFLRALLLGEADELTERFYNDMAIIGVNHTIAISGMHFSMLMAMLVLLFGKGRRGAILTLAVVWFYAMAVGAKPSVMRSAIMFTFLLMAPIVGRERDIATSILGALLVILLANPFSLFSVSLQYSFASTAVICLFASKIYDEMAMYPPIFRLRKKYKTWKKVFPVVAMPLSCTLAVIPITLALGAYYFEVYSLIAPLANVLIQPAISLLFCFGLPITVVGMAWTAVATVLMTPLEWLVEYIIFVTTWLAKIPYAAVFVNSGYMTIFSVFFLILSVMGLSTKEKYGKTLPICCVVLVLLLCCFCSSVEYDIQNFSLTMLDVGQGQSVYLESQGQNALYDCGGSVDNTGEEVARHLQSIGRSGLDVVVVSHYDSDHAGGVAYLLGRTKVERLLLPPYEGDSDMEAEILTAAAQYGVAVTHVDQDLTWNLGKGMIHLYAPVSDGESNDRSLALWFSMGDYDILMTGDMGISAEKALVYQKEIPDLEVLVAGHHGAEGSTGTAILNRTNPEILLISVGADNSYGHPNQATLARIAAIGATVYRTDLQGNITIRR